MDEGLNSFLEYLAEYEWEENFPISGGKQNPLDVIPTYMQSRNQVPIMTQSDSELFDFAFKEYANRWKFKRPTPADFFRTMEDASAVDLDWFWRGWREENTERRPENITQRRNREEGITPRIERVDDLKDFYNENDKFAITNKDRNSYKSFLDDLEDWERKAYDRAMKDGKYLYFVDFENLGGLISPLPLTLEYDDGRTEERMIPAEIWRRNASQVTKLITSDRRIVSFKLDEAHQTADADFSNNVFPPELTSGRIELNKSSRNRRNMMADMLTELKKDGKTDKDSQKDDDKTLPLSEGGKSSGKTPEDKKRSLRKTFERLLGRE